MTTQHDTDTQDTARVRQGLTRKAVLPGKELLAVTAAGELRGEGVVSATPRDVWVTAHVSQARREWEWKEKWGFIEGGALTHWSVHFNVN